MYFFVFYKGIGGFIAKPRIRNSQNKQMIGLATKPGALQNLPFPGMKSPTGDGKIFLAC